MQIVVMLSVIGTFKLGTLGVINKFLTIKITVEKPKLPMVHDYLVNFPICQTYFCSIKRHN
jgi:hypothetical protein